jgi:ABC-type transport system involved in multi-copper enzyme maturation permease subunit
MTHSFAILTTALLFGGMTLYSFGFAAFLFTALPAPAAGAALRLAFPWFYLFVIGSAGLAAVLWWQYDATAATVTAVVALTTVPVRQLLMPAINRATDAGNRKRFKWLHGLSVLVTLGHIVLTGWLLTRLA